jgi:hypothetical protein
VSDVDIEVSTFFQCSVIEPYLPVLLWTGSCQEEDHLLWVSLHRQARMSLMAGDLWLLTFVIIIFF